MYLHKGHRPFCLVPGQTCFAFSALYKGRYSIMEKQSIVSQKISGACRKNLAGKKWQHCYDKSSLLNLRFFCKVVLFFFYGWLSPSIVTGWSVPLLGSVVHLVKGKQSCAVTITTRLFDQRLWVYLSVPKETLHAKFTISFVDEGLRGSFFSRGGCPSQVDVSAKHLSFSRRPQTQSMLLIVLTIILEKAKFKLRSDS